MKSALLVIDVQHGLFDQHPRPYEADAVVNRINALASRARDAGVPVVFVHHETKGGELAYGSQNWELAQRLNFQRGDVMLRKTTPDSFLRTDLLALLESWNTLGFPVVLAADAHTTHDKDHASGDQIRRHHNETLSHIESFGPRIEAIDAAEIMFEL
jgi:nicotinamidase-related amidase